MMSGIQNPSSTFNTSVSSGTTSPSLSASTSQPSAVSGSGQPPTSTLYIYVFGTLLILIGICVAVILRGTILHRQWRRYVEAAIAAGEIPPGDYREGDEIALARARKKQRNRVGPKPDMYDVVLAEEERWLGDKKVEEGGDKAKPFSAMLLPTAASRTTQSPSKIQQRSCGWLFDALRDFRAPDTTASHTVNPIPNTQSLPPTPRTIQASFLISMPSPSPNRKPASIADDASASVEDDGDVEGKAEFEAHGISPVEIGVVSFILPLHRSSPSRAVSSPTSPIPEP